MNPPPTVETLLQLAELYVQVHALQGEAANLYRRYAKLAVSFWQNKPIAAITEIDVHLFAVQLQQKYSSTTAADILRRLRTLLQFAWEIRLINDLPRQWPKIRVVPALPEAWTQEEIARLFRVAMQQPGKIGPHSAGDWWRAFLSTAWDTGLRISQMFRIRLADVDWKRRCLIVQVCPNTKSYRPQIKPLAPETLLALGQIAEPPREILFYWPEWPRSKRDFFSVWRYLCWLAEIPVPRTPRQLTHRWRRSSITQAALGSLEAARRQAGHTSLETTLRHYVDPRLLAQEPPPVPPLERISKTTDFWRERNGDNGGGGNGRKIF